MDTLRDKRRQDELLRVAEQAAGWLITLEEPTAEDRTAFAEWVQESQLHVEMFLRAGAVEQMGELLGTEDRAVLVEQAMAAGAVSNVAAIAPAMPIAEPLTPALSPRAGRGERRRLFGIAAAVLVMVMGGLAAWYGAWDRYTTAVSEQRSVSLDDGSMVYINTHTRVDVRYSDDARELRLVSGEALFKVEPDPGRPFRVQVNGVIAEAVGTQFNIYRQPHRATVAVVEGMVRVGPYQLEAGKAIVIAADGHLAAPVAVNIGQVTAWRQRRLVFEWETLETIAAEFNRYNRAPRIRVEGSEALSRRYTAVFDADNPRTLVRFLSEDGGLDVRQTGDELVIRAR